jgi:hypothetical protein
MTGVGDDSRGPAVSGPWFVVGVTLAGGATVALVLADDIRYLRLGIVAALWAALVGGFLAVRYRKQATSTEEAVAQAQEIYELELEREIAARREFELELESEVRERGDDDARKELEDLRTEIGALRDSLQSLFGGEVLLERLSLTAQATRMRALREEQRLVESSRPGPAVSRPALPPARKPDGLDRPTEMIDRVRDTPVGRPLSRPGAPEPRRAERSMDLPPRRVAKSEPAPLRQNLGGAARSAPEGRAEKTRFQTRATPPPPSKQPSAEMTRPAFGRAERSRPSMPAVDQPTQLSPSADKDRTPPWENKTATGLPPVRDVPPATGNAPARRASGTTDPSRAPGENTQSPAGRPERRPAQRERRSDTRGGLTPVERERRSDTRGGLSPVDRERRSDTRGGLAPVERERRSDTRGGLTPVERSSPPAEVRSFKSAFERKPTPPTDGRELEKLTKPSRKKGNPTLPEEARRLAEQGRPSGRRRRPDDDTPPPEPAGGRRRRAEVTSSSMPPVEERGRRRAGLSRPEMEPLASTERAESEDTGSHSAGRSVSDLLAAHGGSTGSTPPRRRRRAED